WDLNPRYPLRYVRFRGGSFQPLTHLSALRKLPVASGQWPMAIELYELGNCLSLNPPLAKESLQHIPTAGCQHASLDLHSMVQLRVVEYLHHRVDRTSLGIVGAIHQPLDTRVNQGSRAHGARLNCSKQITVSQSMVAQDGARFTQGSDLGVRSWVSARQVAIPPLCDHTAFANQDRKS